MAAQLTYEVKLDILNASENGQSLIDIAELYELTSIQVRKIIDGKDKWMAEGSAGKFHVLY